MQFEPVIPILTSPDLLRLYAEGEAERITSKYLARACQAQAWGESSSLPDHMLKSVLDCALGRGDHVGEMIQSSLEWLATDTLSWRGDQLEVVEQAFERWQSIITRVSPVVLLAWKIAERVSGQSAVSAEPRLVRKNIPEHVFPGFRDPLLDARIEQAGLCDLHIHLNGSTASDIVWQDILAEPRRFRRYMSREQREHREGVEELFLQHSPCFDWKDCCKLVDIACRLRDWLVRRLYSDSICPLDPESPPPGICGEDCRLRRAGQDTAPRGCAQFKWQRRICRESHLGSYSLFNPVPPPYHRGHPLLEYFSADGAGCETAIQLEARFLIRLFLYLRESGNDNVAKFTHYYLLIQSFFNRVLVQQVSQNGFDQFQKITMTGIREPSESRYAERLYQFASGAGDSKIYVEGRVAAKSSFGQLAGLLRAIENGYEDFRNGRRGAGSPFKKDLTQQDREGFLAALGRGERSLRPDSRTGDDRDTRVELGLVAHFIKKKDKRPYCGCQFYNLRRSLEKQARLLLRAYPPYFSDRLMVGFDAAANELDTPPEVFAPVFRTLRRDGMTNFTFHAGEDFHHLISGIRAVDEAVRFLDLSVGARIGHATALGIDPKLWRTRVGSAIWLRKAEWLDNLVYAYHCLLDDPDVVADAAKAREDIGRLSETVYGKVYQPEILWDAWKLRKFDPIRCFVDRDPRITLSMEEREEWAHIEQAKWSRKSHAQAYEIFTRYHEKDVFEQYNPSGKPPGKLKDHYTRVRTDFFSDEALRHMQDRMLRTLAQRKIAIESLLSSNVRISFYQSYGEHHILRWLNLPEASPKPPMPNVCLGTDDPGIFATTMRNEYYHFLQVVQEHVPNGEAVKIVGNVMEQSRAYRFRRH